jgi:hypothetical protein
MLPGISIVAGLLLLVPALEMIAGHVAPVFPRRIATRPLPTRHLARAVRRAIPVLRYLEKAIHPRWHTPLEVTKSVVGVVVLLLTVLLLLAPVPMIQVVPALVIVLISLAYLEGDGVLLSRSRSLSPSLSWESRGWRSGKWSRAPSGSVDLGFSVPSGAADGRINNPLSSFARLA